jgi:hypothetical protein
MESAMKELYRLYRRGRRYYCENNETGQQESLRTSDKAAAVRFLNARNEAPKMAGQNLQISRAYMAASDPNMPKRIWQDVVDFIINVQCEVMNSAQVNVGRDCPELERFQKMSRLRLDNRKVPN